MKVDVINRLKGPSGRKTARRPPSISASRFASYRGSSYSAQLIRGATEIAGFQLSTLMSSVSTLPDQLVDFFIGAGAGDNLYVPWRKRAPVL